MSKKSKTIPKLLTNVLQAVADLKDINGSTSRKILDHVETAIDIKNEKPRPRNVVMQVRRALSHAVETGMLKQRAGKYRLALGQDNEDSHVKKVCSKKKKDPCGKKPKKCHKPKRSDKSKDRKRKPCKRRYNSVATSSAYSVSRYSSSMESLPTDSDYTVRTARRGGRRKSRKGDRKHKSPRRRRSKSRKGGKRSRRRKSRQATPLPPPVEKNKSDTGSEMGGRTRNGSRYQANIHDDFPCEMDQREMDMPPQCDNPECLCNLKQEPYDDNNYDDMNGAGFMM